MQVKKFEAKNMKEALVMIKNQLGPDAIILGSRDIRKGFGLAGEKSVEVTAAISETTLRKKQIAEAKLRERDKQRYMSASAKTQKEFIDKAYLKYEENIKVPPQITETPYISIMDEEADGQEGGVSTDSRVDGIENRLEGARERIRNAAAEASKHADILEPPAPKPALVQAAPQQKKVEIQYQNTQEVEALKSEIFHLRGVIDQFKNMPQNFISMHPGAADGISYELSKSYEKLIRAGINKEFTIEILEHAQNSMSKDQLKKEPIVSAYLAKYILERTSVNTDPFDGLFHVFVGPPGQGKTSQLVKMASHLVICERKNIAIVTTDVTKVGTTEQLKIYSKILNVPFAVIRKSDDWDRVMNSFGNLDHILVDMPGASLKSQAEVQALKNMLPPELGGRSIHYVASVLSKDRDTFEFAKRYSHIEPKDVIFTGIDESNEHGVIYNFQRRLNWPLHSFGIGANIPEDFEIATKERVVDLIFKLTRLNKERERA